MPDMRIKLSGPRRQLQREFDFGEVEVDFGDVNVEGLTLPLVPEAMKQLNNDLLIIVAGMVEEMLQDLAPDSYIDCGYEIFHLGDFDFSFTDGVARFDLRFDDVPTAQEITDGIAALFQPSSMPALVAKFRSSSNPTLQTVTGTSISIIDDTAESGSPSAGPSIVPSLRPSSIPSKRPSLVPSLSPTKIPSLSPSAVPSKAPSLSPSTVPSKAPSSSPSGLPSSVPTGR